VRGLGAVWMEMETLSPESESSLYLIIFCQHSGCRALRRMMPHQEAMSTLEDNETDERIRACWLNSEAGH
jgi:hypothetical protein